MSTAQCAQLGSPSVFWCYNSYMTNSSITAKLNSGLYGAIYCHENGEPERVGPILNMYYNTTAKVGKLVALGSLQEIGRIKSSLKRYASADGDDEPEIFYGATAEEVQRQVGDRDFNYLWDGDKWTVDGSPLAG